MSSEAPKVRVGVGAFVLESSQKNLKNPRFLIGKRLNAHGAGTWTLPGGHLEFGETPEACAAREVMEETGLKVRDVSFLTATNAFMPGEGRHYVTLFMVCVREDDGDEAVVREREKCEGREWVGWEELVGWVEGQGERSGSEMVERKLFVPLVNLVRQRPGLKPDVF